MSTKEEILEKISELSEQYIEDTEGVESNDKYSKNLSLGNQILELSEELINLDADDIDARVWKMRVYAWDELSDTNEIIDNAEFIIENATDVIDRFLGYNWLAWCYDVKLNLPAKSIEVFEEKLKYMASVTDQERSKIDQEYSETYYRMGYVKEMNEEIEDAIDYYTISYQYQPHHNRRNYYGGMMMMQKNYFDQAQPLLDMHYKWVDDQYCVPYCKIIRETWEQGLHSNWGLFFILYCVALRAPKEFGFKNAYEAYDHFKKDIEREQRENPSNMYTYRMQGIYYWEIEKNKKKTYESFLRYLSDPSTPFDQTSTIYFFNSAMRLGHKIDFDFFKPSGTAIMAYNILTEFLDLSYKYFERKDTENEILCLRLAEKFGKWGYEQFDLYFSGDPKGNPINNELHMFAMLCNNLGIAVSRLYWDDEPTKSLEGFRAAAHYHMKGYEISPFLENLDNGLDMAVKTRDYKLIIDWAQKWLVEVNLNYKDRFGAESIITTYRRLMVAYRNEYQFELADKLWITVLEYFDQVDDEAINFITEMIHFSEIYFLTLWDQKRFQFCIEQLNELFSREIFSRVEEEYAQYIFHFYSSKCCIALNNYIDGKSHCQKLIALVEQSDNEHWKEHLPKYINMYAVCIGAPNYEAILREFICKDFGETSKHYPMDLSLENCKWITLMIDTFTDNQLDEVEVMASERMIIRVSRAVPRPDNPTVKDDKIYILYYDERIGINYDRTTWFEEEKTMFGLSKKKQFFQAFTPTYTRYNAFYSDVVEEYLDYNDCTQEVKDRMQHLWNQLLHRFQNFAKI